MWDHVTENLLLILLAVFLIFLNAFFVAAEFALVKVRMSSIKILVREQRIFSKTGEWLLSHLSNSLSACQLGITMASLGLGWIGEPALADLVRPIFQSMGVESETTLHSVAFLISFTAITAVHIVAGEQAPKMLSITRPEFTLLACAMPLRIFYILSYPFMWLLNNASDFLLKLAGLHDAANGSHDKAVSEEELRSLVAGARAEGLLTKSKSRLLEAIFAMDTRLTRQIMVPRPDVIFFRIDQTLEDCFEIVSQTKHTRFPLCKNSLDDVIGVVHIKDLLGYPRSKPLDLGSIARPPRYVPETLPANSLLKKFQASRQHMVFVLDEHGTVEGIVTLENVLEELIGAVQDEFDIEDPEIIPDGPGCFVVAGVASLEKINAKLGISLSAHRIDTITGLLFKEVGRLLKAGDAIDLGPVMAEVMEMRSSRAWKVRLILKPVDKDTGSPSGNNSNITPSKEGN